MHALYPAVKFYTEPIKRSFSENLKKIEISLENMEVFPESQVFLADAKEALKDLSELTKRKVQA